MRHVEASRCVLSIGRLVDPYQQGMLRPDQELVLGSRREVERRRIGLNGLLGKLLDNIFSEQAQFVFHRNYGANSGLQGA